MQFIRLNTSERLIPAIGSIVTSLFQLSEVGFSVSVIYSGCPIYMDKPQILAEATENFFLQFKEQVSFKF
jgi:hypothetical protein